MPAFLAKLDEGYDLVSGWKHPRLDPWTKRWPSLFFNRVTGLVSGIRLHDFNCGFKLYRREVTQEVSLYGELHRYVPVLAHWRGFRIAEIKVHHRPRCFGHSKFGVARFVRGFLDLATVTFLTRYMARPLHLFGLAGTAAFAVGTLINLYLTVLWCQGEGIGTRPMLALGVLLMTTGAQLFSLGLLAELLTKAGAGGRTPYSVRQIVGTPE
jgi:hypothetical protein